MMTSLFSSETLNCESELMRRQSSVILESQMDISTTKARRFRIYWETAKIVSYSSNHTKFIKFSSKVRCKGRTFDCDESIIKLVLLV